jgi:hypothetical protein
VPLHARPSHLRSSVQVRLDLGALGKRVPEMLFRLMLRISCRLEFPAMSDSPS